MRIRSSLEGVLLLVSMPGGCAGGPTTSVDPATPLTVARQGRFLVGGREGHTDPLSPLPADAPSDTISVEQGYAHDQVPVARSGRAIASIHGCCPTGKTSATTPDGRIGRDEYRIAPHVGGRVHRSFDDRRANTDEGNA